MDQVKLVGRKQEISLVDTALTRHKGISSDLISSVATATSFVFDRWDRG